MDMRRALMCGPAAFLWFFAWTVLLDVLRPEYYFAHKAVSELGALGAPYMWAMNLFGFVGTGAMLMLFARGYRAALGDAARVSAAALLLVGLCIALAAVPIAMAPDGDPDWGAPITRVHVLFTQLGLLPWALALFAIMRRHRDPAFRGLALISLLALLAFLGVIVLFGMGVGSGVPGLMQRLWFAVLLGWFAVAGLWLAAKPQSASSAAGRPA
ncbi:hypothetical protein MASR1M8_04730 [Thermomonas brevis]